MLVCTCLRLSKWVKISVTESKWVEENDLGIVYSVAITGTADANKDYTIDTKPSLQEREWDVFWL